MSYYVPSYSTLTQGVPQYGYAVNTMGSDLKMQFQGTMDPATSAEEYAAQQKRAATSAAIVTALTPGMPQGVSDEDAEMIAMMTASEIERQRRRRKKRTTTYLVLGGILAAIAIAGRE
jgi:hypothetical protein